jgi:hypothetical protein
MRSVATRVGKEGGGLGKAPRNYPRAPRSKATSISIFKSNTMTRDHFGKFTFHRHFSRESW